MPAFLESSSLRSSVESRSTWLPSTMRGCGSKVITVPATGVGGCLEDGR